MMVYERLVAVSIAAALGLFAFAAVGLANITQRQFPLHFTTIHDIVASTLYDAWNIIFQHDDCDH